jgi:hypothetical protein
MSRLNTGLTAFEFLFVLPTGSPLACDEAVIWLMKPPVRHSEDLVSGIKQFFLRRQRYGMAPSITLGGHRLLEPRQSRRLNHITIPLWVNFAAFFRPSRVHYVYGVDKSANIIVRDSCFHRRRSRRRLPYPSVLGYSSESKESGRIKTSPRSWELLMLSLHHQWRLCRW